MNDAMLAGALVLIAAVAVLAVLPAQVHHPEEDAVEVEPLPAESSAEPGASPIGIKLSQSGQNQGE